jgi:4-amino-4-deoxy-L-arabinose transferase-like glycosyltransferase
VSDFGRHARYLGVVLGLGIFVLWVIPLSSSFWLDETVTAWVVRDGFRETLHRAFTFQPMFPTYYVVAWLAKTLGGTYEWVLRVPSLFAMAAATFVVARLGRRLFDREAGILAAIVFATSVQGSFMATDARPYALGVLSLVVASLLLIRWLDTGNIRAAAGYIFAAAAVIYVHYLLGFALVAHLVYAVRRRRAVGFSALVAAGLAFLMLLAPMLPWFLDTFRRRSDLSLGLGSAGEVATAVVPAAAAAGLLIGALVAGRGLRIEFPSFRTTRDDVVFLAIWALGPPVLLLAISHITGVGVFTPRYASSALPAISLLAGAAIRMVGPMKARRAIVAATVAVSIVVARPFAHPDDSGFVQDWRGATEAVGARVTDPSTPVVMQSGLIEAQQVQLLRDPAWVPYLLAPASVYGMDGQLVPAPYGLSTSERAYLEGATERYLLPASRFFFVGRITDLSMERWLEGRLEPAGFSSSVVGIFGTVIVVEFSSTGRGG